MRKSSSDEEDVQNQDEGTDTEQHESLPEDIVSVKEARPQVPKEKKKSPSNAFQNVVTGVLSRKPSDHHRPVNLRKESTDSSEAKRVQIKEADPPKPAKEPKREELRGSKQKRNRQANQSPPRTSGTPKEIRRDSSCSIWSENIPTITISKTESAECILETHDKAEKDAVTKPKETAAAKEKLNPRKPKIKYALRKQDAQVDIDSITFGGRELEFTGPGKIDYEDITKTTEKTKVVHKSIRELQAELSEAATSCETIKSVASDSTKTESSTEYKDDTVASG